MFLNCRQVLLKLSFFVLFTCFVFFFYGTPVIHMSDVLRLSSISVVHLSYFIPGL